jgi:hypothetical protein
MIEDEKILKKYEIGRDIDKEDLPILEELRSVRLIHIGISLKRKVLTAKTTALGRGLLGK